MSVGGDLCGRRAQWFGLVLQPRVPRSVDGATDAGEGGDLVECSHAIVRGFSLHHCKPKIIQ